MEDLAINSNYITKCITITHAFIIIILLLLVIMIMMMTTTTIMI